MNTNTILIYIIVELLSNLLIFPLLSKRYALKKIAGEKIYPWLKGVIERLCLILGLSLNFPHILVAFGALKIGTKLGDDEFPQNKYPRKNEY